MAMGQVADVGLGPELLESARRLEAEGRRFALATVVFRRPPVSAHVGDRAIVVEDGRFIGWVGGSCSQAAVRREALAAIRDGRPRLVRLAPDAVESEEAARTTLPMACPSGGEVEVFIEPHAAPARVVAVGDTPLARAVARIAAAIGMQSASVSDAALNGIGLGPGDFVVVASAGAFDEQALAAALAARVRYVALVASRRRAEAVRAVLASIGVDDEAWRRVRTPAGLDIGAATQEEIALSVVAEIVAERRRNAAGAPATADVAPPVLAEAPATARDPVCGMEVEIAQSVHVATVAGTTYHFCCAHCRMRFLEAAAVDGIGA
jgi:xanthine dehydrogenase accessory factor